MVILKTQMPRSLIAMRWYAPLKTLFVLLGIQFRSRISDTGDHVPDSSFADSDIWFQPLPVDKEPEKIKYHLQSSIDKCAGARDKVTATTTHHIR